jgi:hypothetical protein
MISRDEIVKQLSAYYRENGIAVLEEGVSATSFACKHFGECRAAQGCELWNGSEAHVGLSYGDPFGIVVVSLDRGERSEDITARSRSIESLGDQLNPHMRGTKKFLQALLDDTQNPPWARFAMLNSAKCAAKDGSMDSVAETLYNNCAEFTVAEIEILQPRLILTQGKCAQISIRRGAKSAELTETEFRPLLESHADNASPVVLELLVSLMKKYLCVVSFQYGQAVWIRDVPHPSDRFGKWKFFKDYHLRIIALFARELAMKLQG